MRLPESVEGVCEVTVHAAAGSSQKWLLIEVPHGATRKSDYDAVVSKLKSTLPDQLDHFFFVNTDIGAPEGAQWLGRKLSAQGFGVGLALARWVSEAQGGTIGIYSPVRNGRGLGLRLTLPRAGGLETTDTREAARA